MNGAVEFDGTDCFIVRDGVRIAKRPRVMPSRRRWVTWETLVAGFTIRTNNETGEVDLTYVPPTAQ